MRTQTYWLVAVVLLLSVLVSPSGGLADPCPAQAQGMTGTEPDLTCPPRWNVRPSPNLGVRNSPLRGIKAISETDVWTVGEGQIGHYNGADWQFSDYPNRYLQDIAAASANDLWAVGGFYTGSQTLIMRWQGSSWQEVPTPFSGYLFGVTVVSTNDVWAVGYNNYAPLALHWNGTAWQNLSPPITSGELYGVSAISANNVWAVGNDLTLRWDGSAWQNIPNPNSSGTSNDNLFAVKAISQNDVWAVGSRQILRWNGSAWQIVSYPDPGGDFSSLRAVDATGSNDGNYSHLPEKLGCRASDQ